MYGWFEDLPESGERVNTDPELQLGTLVFTSNIPNNSSACSVGGTSYLNYVDYTSGLAVAGTSIVGVMLSNGTTTALASAPKLVRTTTGKIVAITNLSNGSTVTNNVQVSSGGQGTRRLSWRELINGQ
jgi:type IV pilus assembly protein PilY1